jgi:hypothetical protein
VAHTNCKAARPVRNFVTGSNTGTYIVNGANVCGNDGDIHIGGSSIVRVNGMRIVFGRRNGRSYVKVCIGSRVNVRGRVFVNGWYITEQVRLGGSGFGSSLRESVMREGSKVMDHEW